jgi:acyl dehydratase
VKNPGKRAVWNELVEGQTLEPESFGPITRSDVVRYQGASGDMNPIHHDEPFARAAGFEAPLVVGMYPAGVLCAWAAGHFGSENLRLLKIRFKEPVWPGDVLELRGKIARKYQEQEQRKLDLELECRKQGGGVAVIAWQTFVVDA